MTTITRVVSGEASESDSDDELTAAAELVAGRSQSSIGEELRQAGVVVQGEASETDSEEDEEMHLARAEQQQFPSQSNIPPLKGLYENENKIKLNKLAGIENVLNVTELD